MILNSWCIKHLLVTGWWLKQKSRKSGNGMDTHRLAGGSHMGYKRHKFKAVEYRLSKWKVEQLGLKWNWYTIGMRRGNWLICKKMFLLLHRLGKAKISLPFGTGPRQNVTSWNKCDRFLGPMCPLFFSVIRIKWQLFKSPQNMIFSFKITLKTMILTFFHLDSRNQKEDTSQNTSLCKKFSF